ELADQLGIDPLALREKNAARDGVKALHGPTWQNIGYAATVEAPKNHPHMKEPLGPNQGRGVASGFWFNIGGESSAACHINEDGTAVVVSGNPDIGGSAAPAPVMGAEGGGARRDRDEGGRGAGPPGRKGPSDRRRYQLDRFLVPDRRQPRHLCDRHG